LIFRDLIKVGVLAGTDPKEDGAVQPKGVDGYKLESNLKFDYTKPIYQQLVDANLQWDDYVLYINEPKHLINPVRDVRLFENDLLESLTKTSWFMIPLCWLPMSYLALYLHNFSWETSGPLFLLGILLWSFFEYTLHRFLFHSEDSWLPNHPKVLVIHFFVHGIHHAFP
jgi:4-hydroxysphinganine ceramide fatty acyl 2-hydroxylase